VAFKDEIIADNVYNARENEQQQTKSRNQGGQTHHDQLAGAVMVCGPYHSLAVGTTDSSFSLFSSKASSLDDLELGYMLPHQEPLDRFCYPFLSIRASKSSFTHMFWV